MEYDDGEVRQQFSICFACDLINGQQAELEAGLRVMRHQTRQPLMPEPAHA